MATLQAEYLSFSLQGRRVVHQVSLTVCAGEVVGIIGANGSGKSTFLKGMAGLLQPEEGKVYLLGEPLSGQDPRLVAQKVAYLPQNPECFWPLEVEALVRLGRLPFSDWESTREEAVAAALTAVDGLSLRGRTIDALSGGERARVFLARALVGNPQFLLADEPGAGLDPFHQLQLMELLKERAKKGDGVCLVLHDLSLAARFCDRLLVLDQGRPLFVGTPEEVLSPENLAKAHGVTAFRSQYEGAPVILPWERVKALEGEETSPS